MKAFAALLVLGSALAACGPKPTTCGEGTHADGGVCVEDPAYAITNPQNLGAGAYWNCLTDPVGEFAIQFSPGTGSYKDLNPAGSVQSFNWQEGSGSNSILITSNTPTGVPFAELLGIVGTPALYPNRATFTLDEAANPSAVCTVEIGSIGDAGCVAYYPYCNCPGWISDNGTCAQAVSTGGACPCPTDAGVCNGCQCGYEPGSMGVCVPEADAG